MFSFKFKPLYLSKILVLRLELNYLFTDCSSPPHPKQVVATSSSVGSVGKFSCSNGGVLFDSNGRQLTTNETQCNANAQWSGLDNVECWKGT